MLKSNILICDDPATSFIASVQAQILNLLEQTEIQIDLMLIFIAHNIAVVTNISDGPLDFDIYCLAKEPLS